MAITWSTGTLISRATAAEARLELDELVAELAGRWSPRSRR
jgi:hypothetical protein